MKRNFILLGSLAVLPLATPQASDPPTIRPGTYTVCDDSRDPSGRRQAKDRAIGAAAEVQFEERAVSMVASAEGRQLGTVVEFAHLQNLRVRMMKHLVRVVADPGYNGTGCMSNVLAINFCPPAEDGTWQCRVLACHTEGACHLVDTHVEN